MNPCDTCALTPGAQANCEPHNALKAILCKLGAIPFYCHHNQDWANPEAHRPVTRQQMRDRQIHICLGWQREVKELAATGYFDKHRLILRAYAQCALDELFIFLAAEDGSEDKEEARDRLEQICRSLGERMNEFTSGYGDGQRTGTHQMVGA